MRETENLEFITIGVYPCVRVPRVYCVGRSEPCVWATIYGPFLYSLTLRPPPLPRPSTVHRRLCRICPVHFDSSHTLVFIFFENMSESLRGRELSSARPRARALGRRPRAQPDRGRAEQQAGRAAVSHCAQCSALFSGKHQTCVVGRHPNRESSARD